MTTQVKAKPKVKPASQASSLQDLIIIGGGIAGLTAALYALRSRLKTLLVEKMVLGGKAATAVLVENYPGFPEGVSGMELTTRIKEQVKKLGPQTQWGSAVSVKKKKELFEVQVDDKTWTAKAVIVASGTEAAKLGVPGENELRGRGVSYCATCDGPFYKDKNVIVIGGGNTAIEEALFLTRYANKVSIVHRRDELRADVIVREKALANPKIYFFWHSTVKEIKGKDKVEAVVLSDLQTNKSLTVPADGVFVYVGSKPNTEAVSPLVKLDDNGFIITDENMKTSCPGLFAAGDVRSKTLRQMVTAAADGAIAAESARNYIEGKS